MNERDFSDPHADLKQAKAVLAARIIAVLDKRKLTVRKATGMTGFAAADFSRVRNADLGRFTWPDENYRSNICMHTLNRAASERSHHQRDVSGFKNLSMSFQSNSEVAIEFPV